MGQGPYTLSLGNIQIAGHSQSLGEGTQRDKLYETLKEYGKDRHMGQLGSHFHTSIPDTRTPNRRKPCTLNWVDDCATSRITDFAARLYVSVHVEHTFSVPINKPIVRSSLVERAVGDVVHRLVEDGVVPNVIGGESGDDVQLPVFHKRVVLRGRRHLELAVAENRMSAIDN